ncbi:MAG: hypothetical protein ACJAZ3_001730 [Sphingobacteriales bacterium]|jgi:hypothetical protein
MYNSKIKILVTLLIISTIAFSACKKDELTEPANHSGDLPIIPEPTVVGTVTRETSDTITVEYSSALAKFSPFEMTYTLYTDTMGCNDGESFQTDEQNQIYEFDSSEAVYKIRHRRYWKKVYSKVLGPGTSFNEEKTYTQGYSETNSEEFEKSITATAEVGAFGSSVSVSATLSSKFSKSVTVNSETTETVTNNVTGREGFDRVFTIWQLRDLYDIVDPLNNPVPTTERLIERLRGDDRPQLIDYCINKIINGPLTTTHETSSSKLTYSAEQNTKDKWCTDRINIKETEVKQNYHFVLDNGDGDTFLHTKDFKRK